MHSRSAAVLVALIVALSAPVRGADLAKLVPEDVLLYAEVADPAGIWADFEQSGLRDIIRSVPQAEVQLRLVTAIVKQVAITQFGVQWDDFVGDYLLVARSGACLNVAAEGDGVLVESYTRPGLLPLVGALVGFVQTAPRPAPAAEPTVPKPADF